MAANNDATSSTSDPIAPLSFEPLDPNASQRNTSLDPMRVALIAVLLSFAVVLWFIFTAKSVQFQYTPASAAMDIDGGIAINVGNRFLMRPGDFTIALTAPGYYPLEVVDTVGEADSQTFVHSMEKLPGRLSITSSPAGARLSIDGEARGVLPTVDLEVTAGTRSLSVAAERYLPWRDSIEIKGMETRQSLEVKLDPAWAEVSIDSEPSAANIIIDGEPRGTTPAIIELLQGTHELGIELVHHQSWQQTLSVTAGEPQNLGTLPLLAADGWLELTSSPSGANVTIDGEFRGQTPSRIALRPTRSHRVAVYKPGYKTRNTSIKVDADEEKSLNLRLEAQLGRLRVAMSPADAELFINGKSYGSASQTIEIPAFEQTLEIRRAGYRSHRQRITPRPGFEQALSIALKTESEARIADLPAIQQSSIGAKLKLFTPDGLTMGASRREPGRRSNEVLRPVELTRMFYMGLHEVTNADYRNFQKDFTAGQVEGNSLDGDRQPVVFISWEKAAAFCNWLSGQDQFPPYYKIENEVVVGVDESSTGYRMPTEAEWAWAARTGGPELLKYPWGSNLPPGEGAGNYADASSSYITGRTISNYDDSFIVTAPVGSFAANQRGLYDMGGNVAEWINDYYGVSASSGVIERDPTGPTTGENRVIRGASWAHGTVTELRLSYRDYGREGRDDLGFRLARYAEEGR